MYLLTSTIEPFLLKPLVYYIVRKLNPGHYRGMQITNSPEDFGCFGAFCGVSSSFISRLRTMRRLMVFFFLAQWKSPLVTFLLLGRVPGVDVGAAGQRWQKYSHCVLEKLKSTYSSGRKYSAKSKSKSTDSTLLLK